MLLMITKSSVDRICSYWWSVVHLIVLVDVIVYSVDSWYMLMTAIVLMKVLVDIIVGCSQVWLAVSLWSDGPDIPGNITDHRPGLVLTSPLRATTETTQPIWPQHRHHHLSKVQGKQRQSQTIFIFYPPPHFSSFPTQSLGYNWSVKSGEQ